MKKLLPLVLLFLGACQDNRVGEDFWYGNSEILCQREHCPRCGETRGITCPNCNGVGEVTCDTCYGKGKLKCSSCGGSGKDGQNTCSDCSGTGYQSCWDCGGDGEETCGVCSGKKKVACIQRIPVHQTPATRAEDAWPPNNYQGSKPEN